jgi:hypothetical protein
MSYRTHGLVLLVAVFLMAAGWPATATAQLPNLTYYYAPNWQYPVLPTTIYCPLSNMVVPPTLPGNAPVYLNDSGINDGTGSALNFQTAISIDGEIASLQWIATLLAGEQWGGCGIPSNVRGGRHTIELKGDVYDDVVESDETDNNWAHQFVFTPYVLSESTPKTRGAPPSFIGGWSSIIDLSPTDWNCDGFRFSSSGWWNAIILTAQDNADDYDLELHAPSTGSEDGFIGSTLGSYYLEGILDALIVNRNTVGITDYDVGVINATYGEGGFVIEQVVSEPAYVGDSISVVLGAGEYLRIWDTYIGDTGWVSVSVDDLTADGEDIMVGWAEYDVTEIALPQITEWEVTDDNGLAWFHKDFSVTGYYGLVIYRNPIDGGLPKTLQVKIEPTPPDLLPLNRPDWHSPLVPTPVSEWIHPIPLPDTLHGYMSETYINYSLENYSPTGAPPTDVGVIQDGMPGYMTFQTLAIAGFGAYSIYDGTGREIPGGRHTLTLDIDHTDSLHEIYENNNTWGEQYCWSPLELSLGWQYSHFAPGPFAGGFLTINSGETIFSNCDGYRLYTGYGNWEGMVLTQGPNSDYDLSIHYALAGVKEGFDDYLTSSYFLAGETDYVLFNNNVLPVGVHDIGVENVVGDEDYTIEAVGSSNLPDPVSGTYGPYGMPVAHMLHLYNLFLDQDLYAFRLDNLAGVVDWGIALHPHDVPYGSRNDLVPGGTAYLNGPGDPEWFTVEVPAAGWYGLAVFKTGPLEFDKDGEYELRIMQGVSDVPDEPDLPAATALAGVHPNPFNPQTTISYELASPAAVELAIYDLKGALVRRLVSESMPAGRHETVWNGQDDAGARVASGVYLTRFKAGAHHEVRKVVMVK